MSLNVADLLTVETFLVLVRTRRLGLDLILAILAFRLLPTVLAFTVFALAILALSSPLSTEKSIGTMSFSFLALATVDTSLPILSKDLSLPAWSGRRFLIDASLRA